MPVSFRTKNSLLLGVAESPSGTQGSPTPGANAIRMDAPVYSANFDKMDTNFAQESVSQSPPIIGRGMVGLSFNTFLTPCTVAGVAPDYGIALRGCAMQETLTAADVTGTAQAGASGSVTLAVGASSSDNAYKGMVVEITAGTGNGQRAVISGYTGSSKVATVYPNWTTPPDATSTYNIRKNTRYLPITTAQESLTLWAYQRNSASGGLARLRKLIGAMGNAKIGIKPGSLASLGFQFTGQLPSNPADVSDPGTATYTGLEPKPYLSAKTYLGGSAVAFNSFSLDLGNSIKNFDDPSQLYGYDTCEITQRIMTGSITPALSLIATRDSFSDWLASTSKPLWMCWGAAGSGVSLYLPALRYTGNQPGDVNGFQTESIPFQATGTDGEAYLCIF